MKICKIINSEKIQISITENEAAWLGNSMNEVLHGIRNVEISKTLLVPKPEACQFHDKFIASYKNEIWREGKSTIILFKNELLLFRRAIIAVMHEFNKYNEYHVRLGVEFDEYLDLLADINRILEEVCIEAM